MTASPADRPSSPILVVHGALGSASQMLPVVEALGALAPVLNVELPGHGATPIDERPFAIETFVDALRDARDASRELAPHTAEPPRIFGYSMGGYVALALEIASPGSFSRIVALGTKFDWTPESAAFAASRLDPDVVAGKVPAFAELLAARHTGAGGWRNVMRRTAAMVRMLGQSPVLTEERLARIDTEVVIAAGTRDDTLTPDEASMAAAAIPRARHVALDGIPHPIERVPTDAIVRLMSE